MLPKDPVMLLSVINMKLRDQYASLEALCEDMDADEQQLRSRLLEVGYEYSAARNQFI